MICIIADQGFNYQKLFTKLLDVQKDKHYVMDDSRKYYVIYDPLHLIKIIRNNLQSSGFKGNEKLISWQHIKNVYELTVKAALECHQK